MKQFYWCSLLILILCVNSCVSLKTVNTYSITTATSLQQYKTLPVTFTSIYQQRMQDDSLDLHPFNKIPVIGIDFARNLRRDSLRSYQTADSLIWAGSVLLIDYFQALAAFSTTTGSFIPVRLKSATFDTFLQNSAVKLTPDQTAAFNRTANLLGSIATGAYRRRKLNDLLEHSYDDVRQMVTVLSFAYERLADVVDINREQQYNQYKNVLIRDSTLSYTQKRDLARQWLRTADEIEQTRQAVLIHVKTLNTVRMGYDECYKNRRKWSAKASVTSVGAYITTMQQLRSDLEQLTPVYGRLHP